MKTFLFIFVLTALISCNSAQKKTAQTETRAAGTAPELELLWESDTLLRTPESVLIDRERNVMYVSNVNLNPWQKDGNGFISKMDMQGNITELKWIEGLDAPKGMGISGNSLFIADIDVLVEANIETGEIINRIEFDDDPQLNDITVGQDGTVYVSGSNSQKIYAMDNGNVDVYLEGEEGERFNGLYWENDRMLLITSASSQFKEIDHNTREVNVIAEDMGHGDGIAPVGDGGYITTSWAGKIFYISADGETTTLLDTEDLKENTADIDFSIENQILYVPTFFKNQVKAYKLILPE
jgi:outer membrane protein assembly factor BamB